MMALTHDLQRQARRKFPLGQVSTVVDPNADATLTLNSRPLFYSFTWR